jgi:hypothetical protein
MKKDYDKDSFDAYMNSLFEYLNELNFKQEVRVSKIMRQQDKLEVAVATRPCYNSVEELMNAVKGM